MYDGFSGVYYTKIGMEIRLPVIDGSTISIGDKNTVQMTVHVDALSDDFTNKEILYRFGFFLQTETRINVGIVQISQDWIF